MPNRRGGKFEPVSMLRRNLPVLKLQQAGKQSDSTNGQSMPKSANMMRRIGGKWGRKKNTKNPLVQVRKSAAKNKGADVYWMTRSGHAQGQKLEDARPRKRWKFGTRKQKKSTWFERRTPAAQMQCWGNSTHATVAWLGGKQCESMRPRTWKVTVENAYRRGVRSRVIRLRLKIHPLRKRMGVCTTDMSVINAPRGANLRRPAKTSHGASCRVQPW